MNTLRNIKSIVFTAIAAAIAFLAKSIGSFLSGLGSIPIIGFLFKILAVPFNLIGKLQKLFIILLIIMIFIVFVLPIIKGIIKRIKLSKAKRAQEKMEEQELASLSEDNTSASRSKPSRLEF